MPHNNEKLRAVLDATPFPVALVDLQDDRIFFWSSSALALFGHTAPTASQWYHFAYPDPDYRREVVKRWKPALEVARHQSPRAVNAGEYRIACGDGSERICELYAAFIGDYLVVTFNDITERKLAEESKERFGSVFECSAVGMALVGHDGRWVQVNKALCEMLGYSEQELLATNFQSLTHPDDLEADLSYAKKVFTGQIRFYHM